MIQFTHDERVMLWESLQNHFSPQDLQNLAYRLGLKEGEIEYKNLSQFARELIGYFERRELLVELLAGVHYHNPNRAVARLLSRYARQYNQKLLLIRLQEDAPLDWDAVRTMLAERLGRKMNRILAAGWLSKHDLLFVVTPANAADDTVREALEDPSAGGYAVLGLGAFDDLDRSSPGVWPPQPPQTEKPATMPPVLPKPDRNQASFGQRAGELAEGYRPYSEPLVALRPAASTGLATATSRTSGNREALERKRDQVESPPHSRGRLLHQRWQPPLPL